MPILFYVRRFVLAFAVSATVISIAQLLKGNPLNLVVPDGLLWGAITAAIYTAVLGYKLRNSACRVVRKAE